LEDEGSSATRHLCIVHCTNWSVRPETPRDRLTPTDPSTERGCRAIDRPVPPNRRLAPTPTPTPIAPLAPTYVPASAPRFGPAVGANTPHAMTPPAVIPTSRPIVPITPTYSSGGPEPLGVNRQAIRCREPKIKPMEGAILQASVPTLVPGGCWATAGDTNAAANATNTSAMRYLNMTKLPAFWNCSLAPLCDGGLRGW